MPPPDYWQRAFSSMEIFRIPYLDRKFGYLAYQISKSRALPTEDMLYDFWDYTLETRMICQVVEFYLTIPLIELEETVKLMKLFTPMQFHRFLSLKYSSKYHVVLVDLSIYHTFAGSNEYVVYDAVKKHLMERSELNNQRVYRSIRKKYRHIESDDIWNEISSIDAPLLEMFMLSKLSKRYAEAFEVDENGVTGYYEIVCQPPSFYSTDEFFKRLVKTYKHDPIQKLVHLDFVAAKICKQSPNWVLFILRSNRDLDERFEDHHDDCKISNFHKFAQGVNVLAGMYNIDPEVKPTLKTDTSSLKVFGLPTLADSSPDEVINIDDEEDSSETDDGIKSDEMIAYRDPSTPCP